MEQKEFLLNLIVKITIPEEFGSWKGEDYCLPYEIEEIFNGCGEEWTYNSGASKLAVIFPNLGVVLKFPFNGYLEEKEYEGEHCDECDSDCCCFSCCPYRSTEENEFIHFESAREEDGWNYCAVEEDYYQQAVDEGFDIFFAFTEYLGETKNHHPVYIQEYCIPNDNFDSKGSYDSCSINSKNHVKDLIENGDFRNYFGNTWSVIAIEKYGEEFFDKFMLEFAQTYNHLFGDMHDGNFGFRPNGTPVIFDFSDFWD